MNPLIRPAKPQIQYPARISTRSPLLGIAATWMDRLRDAPSVVSRWCKFNVVGAMGMAVQLSTLALVNRLTAGHYLVATVIALEVTLVHNFVWHLHYTWRDRRDRSALIGQFVRFHLSNGLVSMAGNLALMPLLVREGHIPVVASNAIAILCCSLANFCLGHNWAFAARVEARQG
jgi:putative flippase GtrA